MLKLNRDEIHLINKHSNWSRTAIKKSLDQYVYSSSEAWIKFLK